MKYTDCIRNKPWLRRCNVNGINERIAKETRGNAFIVFNNIHKTYELHTISSFKETGESYNATIPIEFLNQFIITDYKATDNTRFRDDNISRRMKMSHVMEHAEKVRRPAVLKDQMRIIERVLGTKG